MHSEAEYFFCTFFKSVLLLLVFFTSEIHDGKVLISFNLLAFLCFPYFLLIFPSTLMVLNVDISREKIPFEFVRFHSRQFPSST